MKKPSITWKYGKRNVTTPSQDAHLIGEKSGNDMKEICTGLQFILAHQPFQKVEVLTECMEILFL